MIGIGTVTLTVTGAILLVKKYRSKLQQKQNTKGKEVEETLDKTEKEINKKVEETLDKTKKDSKKKNELALIPGRNYDIGWKPMSSKEIKDSQEKVLIKKEKEYIGAHEVTIANKNLGSDEDIKKKVDRRLEELKKWEAEQKNKCTGLVIDEYASLSAELSVIESTIDTLDQEIDQLNESINENLRRKYNITGADRNPSFRKDEKTGKYNEPEINNKVYKYIFNIANKIEKLNLNNVQETIQYIDKISNDAINDSNVPDKCHYGIHDTSRIVKSLKYIDSDFTESDLNEYKSTIKHFLKQSVEKIVQKNIFCTSSPYDYLNFAVHDSTTLNKRREAVSQINDALIRQYDTRGDFITNKSKLDAKRSELKSRIDEGKKKKDAEQKAFNKTREKNLEDIKTVSGKGGYDVLYNKIKDEVKKA